MRWLIVLLMLVSAAHAEPRAIAATSRGTALVLDGGLYEVSDAGRVLRATTAIALSGEHWVLTADAVVHRGVARPLGALPDVLDTSRRSFVVELDAGRALVVRPFGPVQKMGVATTGGTRVEIVDDGGVTELLTLEGWLIDAPLADGQGGFWCIVRRRAFPSSDGYAGYAHYSAGQWTLWRLPEPTVSSYVTELPPMRVLDATDRMLLDELVPASDGGAVGRLYGRLYRIAADGALSVIRDVKADHVCAVTPVGASRAVVWTSGLRAVHVTMVDAHANVTSTVEVPLPDWYAQAKYPPPVHDCVASGTAEGVLWIATGPFVIRRAASGVLTTFGTPQRLVDGEPSRVAAAAVIATPPLVAAGVVLASDANPGHALAASAMSLPATLLLDVLDGEPCVSGNDSGYQLYNDAYCVLRTGGYLVGISGAGALGALGIKATGAEGGSYQGAIVGGMLGSVVSIGTTKLLRRYAPSAGRWTRAAVASTLVGVGASLGYAL